LAKAGEIIAKKAGGMIGKEQAAARRVDRLQIFERCPIAEACNLQ
jgi:hypothetical protein